MPLWSAAVKICVGLLVSCGAVGAEPGAGEFGSFLKSRSTRAGGVAREGPGISFAPCDSRPETRPHGALPAGSTKENRKRTRKTSRGDP